jgi:hypothetical protein
LAEQHQLQREPAQTPTEFLEPLTDRWPTLAAQFNSITEAYINVHYGELPEVQETAAQVQQAWESVYTSISRGESNRNEAHQGAK